MGSRLTRYLSRSSDGQKLLPPHLYDSGTFVPRLSFKGRTLIGDYSALAENIAALPESADVYLDSNIWDVSLGEEVWDALTHTSAQVRVTPFVLMEIGSWTRSHPSHAGMLGFRGDTPSFEIEMPFEEGSEERIAESYYTYLLSMRRCARNAAADQLRRGSLDSPTDQQINAHTQKLFGERGLQLVYKRGKIQASGTPTDENLVYRAAARAVRSGRPTILLSSDEDVLEQFYKLWWFLDTHYRAMLLGDEYLRDPLAYRHHGLSNTERNRDIVDVASATLVERGAGRMNAVLPDNPEVVVAECWIPKPKSMLKWVFAAEQGMARLLDVKGKTGGRSTDLPGGRNLHPWLAGLNVSTQRLADSFLVVADRTFDVPGGSAHVSMLDAMHSVNNHERHSNIVRGAETGPRLWTP